MVNNDCSVLVLSCDKNISLLNIFFDFYEKNWPDCPYKIYLGMEKASVKYKNVEVLNSQCKKWADRVLEYLNSIETNYLMIILDDFLPESKVDTQRIQRYVEYLQNDNHIATISLAEIYDKNNYLLEDVDLCQRKPNSDFLLNLQVGIWDKKFFAGLIRQGESPWQTELFGSIRARKYTDKRYLCLRSDNDSPFRYGRGWLMVRGMWNGNEIVRLGLHKYAEDIFDGKDIIFSGFGSINFPNRVIRRIQIQYRKILSTFKIFI